MDSKRLRRMAADVDEEHREAMRRVHDDLATTWLAPDGQAGARRAFLRGVGATGVVVAVGGLSVSLDAIVRAAAAQTTTPTTSAGPTSTTGSTTGSTTTVASTTSGAPTTTTTLPPRQPDEQDRALLGFVQSVELMAAAAYGIALGSTKLTDATAEIATIFQAHHREHAQAGGSLAGTSAATKPNASLLAVYGPRLQAAAGEQEILEAVLDIENAATATYAAALGTVRGTDPAATMASILPIESRHAVVLGQLLHLDLASLAPVVESLTAAATPQQFPIEEG